MKSLSERLREILDDPDEVDKMKIYFSDIKDKKIRNNKRVRSFFNNDETFSIFLLRLIKKHDERWANVCYENGSEPYPWNLLESIFELVQHNGDEVTPVDDLTSHFSSLLMEYRSFTFSWTFGQGTCISIYNNDKELIFRL